MLCQVGEVVAGFLGARASGTHDGHLVEGRIELVQIFPAKSQLGQGGGAKRRQQDIGLGQLLLQAFLAACRLEVGCLHADALMQLVIGLTLVVAHRIAGWGLQFDAVRTHLAAALQRCRTGQIQAQAEDADTFQGLNFFHSHIQI